MNDLQKMLQIAGIQNIDESLMNSTSIDHDIKMLIESQTSDAERFNILLEELATTADRMKENGEELDEGLFNALAAAIGMGKDAAKAAGGAIANKAKQVSGAVSSAVSAQATEFSKRYQSSQLKDAIKDLEAAQKSLDKFHKDSQKSKFYKEMEQKARAPYDRAFAARINAIGKIISDLTGKQVARIK